MHKPDKLRPANGHDRERDEWEPDRWEPGDTERLTDPALAPEIPAPPGRDIGVGRTADVDKPPNTDDEMPDIPEPPD